MLQAGQEKLQRRQASVFPFCHLSVSITAALHPSTGIMMGIFFMQKCFADIRTVQLYFVILPMCMLMVYTHWKNDFQSRFLL